MRKIVLVVALLGGCVFYEGQDPGPDAASACPDLLDEAASAWCWRALECGALVDDDVDACVAELVAVGECVGDAEECRTAIEWMRCDQLDAGWPAAACPMLR